MPAAIAQGIRGFADGVRRAVEDAVAQALAVRRAVVRETGAELVARTPVVTGHLVANWHVVVGDAEGVYVPDLVDPQREATTARIAEAAAAIDLTTPVAIVNETPYGAFVEFGTSRMAPRAFVRGTVAAAPGIVDRAIASTQR